MATRKMGTKQASRSEKVWPYNLAVALLPLIVLWHRDSALYAPPWYADSWFYLGYFRNLVEFKTRFFPKLYYGSRLSWVLPGFLVHSLFSPIVANCVLHLTVHLVATLSLFSTLRLTAGARRAFLATMVFSVQPWLWAATGWDYPDGAGIAYCLLAMALLTRGALQPAGKWSLLAAGMALAAMVYAHLFLAALTPLLLLYYLGSAWAWRRTPPIREAARLFLWTGAGFGIVTAAFCSINYLLDGNVWFYAPSIAQARNMSSNFMYFRPVWLGHQLVPWLWPAVAGSAAAILLLPSRIGRQLAGRNATALLFSAQLLLAFAFMAYLQTHGSTVLGHHPYVSYLLPFAFLAMGISFWPAVETLSLRAYAMVCGAAAVVFSAAWFERLGMLLLPAAQDASLVFCAGTLSLALLLRRRMAGTLLAIAGFAAFCSVSLIQTTSLVWGDLHGSREQYQRIMHARERIEAVRAGRDVRFWYDKKEPAYFDYFALNGTYLAEFRRMGTNFPYDCEGSITYGTLVVVTSRNPDTPRVAESALTTCWSGLGLKPAIEEVDPVSGANPYTMAILRAEYDFATMQPLRADFNPQGAGALELVKSPQELTALPNLRWVPIDKGSMQDTPDGLIVRTPPGSEAYAVTYAPLVAPVTGTYRFLIRYKPFSGHVAFGAFPPDQSRWLTFDLQERWVGEDRELFIDLSLNRGETVLLRIANHTASGRPASFLLKQLSAIKVNR